MDAAEAGVEREKLARIRAVASRGGAVAERLGQDPYLVKEFLGHYFRHVDAEDIATRPEDDLLGLVVSHFRLALDRPAARAAVAVFTPTRDADGWSADGPVVQMVTDDHPFLVDSVTMEIVRQGWTIRQIFHPQFLVRRDVTGRLRTVVHAGEAAGDSLVVPESWMHLEVTPPADHHTDAGRRLQTGLLEVLGSVEEAVADWAKMRSVAETTAAALTVPPGIRAEEVETARELLSWLTRDNFTFLGSGEFTLSDGDPAGEGARTPGRMQPVPGTGLGILRSDQAAIGAFAAVPLPAEDPPRLMVITKDDAKARVHRPSYLDYIGIRRFDDTGRVIGERRFLGLFASTAYTDSVTRIPVLRQKAAAVLHRSGYDPSSHGAKAIVDVLNSYPRDELFQAGVGELAPVIERISRLRERRQVRVFVRLDPYGRYASCLVYFPRDRYTTLVRSRMQQVLLARLGGASVDYTTRVSESVLARLHFVVRMPPSRRLAAVDVADLERRLTTTTRSWQDDFADQVAGLPDAADLLRMARTLPDGYREDFTPRQAIKDLQELSRLSGHDDMALALYRPDRSPEAAGDQADLRLKIFRSEAPMSLSRVLPHLSLLGVDVVDEHPYELPLPDDRTGHVYEFGFRVPGGAAAVDERWTLPARRLFMDAFRASYTGLAEADPYNALVMGADLGWREVALLRAIGRYLRQGGMSYSQTYLAQALAANVAITRMLVDLFRIRFDPDPDPATPDRATPDPATPDRATPDRATPDRDSRQAGIVEQIRSALDEVTSLDHDRIIRTFLTVINACVRTNFFRPGIATITLKLLPRKIPGLPEPRPAYEIWVYSPRVEGVHLRFGPVARGGLRWSDRSEDFRTEVLGLVKAQMVKNTVIVPVGAKGGFYCRQLPDPADRDAWLAEGIDCYRLFVGSLLDVTDNIVRAEVRPPDRVVRHDGDDPYLVVAADKGTASFSDIANQVALERGYWLGDAFASGGSAGYDHKRMGITARGAWESVKRHFRELGVDVQKSDVTVVGIGDMSGDVFGNGMLLSHHLKLLAAFDHRHLFIDPDPDPQRSWAERQRLFELPRSSWADYDESLISEGGGVFSRQLKSIMITDPMRKVFGIPAEVREMSPAEMIKQILTAPVDLLFNGGVGTYVKAARETHADVGDKANDVLRVNGADIRARCVGEGGNLGFTQLGRVEYAAAGGRINTDFIDNSAGVDTSDHEVNIKILLADEVADGRLSLQQRDDLLAAMTDEVAELVLANNEQQNLALANSQVQAGSMAGVHEDWMQRLADQGLVDRQLEFLPDSAEMAERREAGTGLTGPELAVLLAYTKIVLEREVLSSDLPDDPALQHLLVDYFPQRMREPYADRMPAHRLHREIITTAAVNRFVNQSGITCFHRLSLESGAVPGEVIKAQIAARMLFGADEIEQRFRGLDHRIDADVQTGLRLQLRTLTERATRWLIMNRRAPLAVSSVTGELAAGVRTVVDALPDILTGRDAEAFDRRRSGWQRSGVDAELAIVAAALPPAAAALPVVQTAVRDGQDPLRVARVHFAAGQRLGLDRLLARITDLPRTDRWQTMARAALRDDLVSVHSRLTAEMLALGDPGTTVEELVDRWQSSVGGSARAISMIADISAGEPDLARMSVGLRTARSLLGSAT